MLKEIDVCVDYRRNFTSRAVLLPVVAEVECSEIATTKVDVHRKRRSGCMKHSMPAENFPLSKKRRVRFGSSNLTHNDEKALYHDECQTLWYSRRSLRDMKRSAKQFCASIDLESELFQAYVQDSSSTSEMENSVGILRKASILCKSEAFERQRGLERWSWFHHMYSRCVSIVNVRTEVMLEQASQLIKGESEPERLAQVYREASSQSVQYARVLGLADTALCDR